MRLKDTTMCDRVAEEVFKLGPTNTMAAQKIGCDRHIVSDWINGRAIPSAYYLKAMCEAGMDVIYILTGRRTKID